LNVSVVNSKESSSDRRHSVELFFRSELMNNFIVDFSQHKGLTLVDVVEVTE